LPFSLKWEAKLYVIPDATPDQKHSGAGSAAFQNQGKFLSSFRTLRSGDPEPSDFTVESKVAWFRVPPANGAGGPGMTTKKEMRRTACKL